MLPAEPEVLDARKAFLDAQAALEGAPLPGSLSTNFVNLGWYGTQISDERGSFAMVSSSGPFSDLIGERIKIHYQRGSALLAVNAYVVQWMELPYDIGVTRRLFAALELLSVQTIPVLYEIMQ